MNEKDTIIKLQKEVNEGLRKELNTVYYCANELMKECKRLKKSSKYNSIGYYIMGIGTGLVLSSIIDYFINKKINEEPADSDTTQCNDEV